MSPRLGPGATLLIDRHYNSLKPYRKGDFNLYAVLENDNCAVRYVEIVGNQLLLVRTIVCVLSKSSQSQKENIPLTIWSGVSATLLWKHDSLKNERDGYE